MYFIAYQHVVKPKEQLVEVLDTAHFECISNHKVNWTYNGKILPSNTVVERLGSHSLRHTLTLYNIVKENGGNYICKGTDEDTFVFEDKGILKVKGKMNKVRKNSVAFL